MIWAVYAFLVSCGMCVLISAAALCWSLLNSAGAALGRGIAWFCSGGPGRWHLARIQIGRERQAEAMAALLLDMASWRAAPAPRSRGLAQHVTGSRCPQQCGWCPAPDWCANQAALERYASSPHRGGLPGEAWKPGRGWVPRG